LFSHRTFEKPASTFSSDALVAAHLCDLFGPGFVKVTDHGLGFDVRFALLQTGGGVTTA
jgi:hypothetical protein